MESNLSDEGQWIKPKLHPCKKKYKDISESEFDEDCVDLLNTVQWHTQCNSAYRLLQQKNGKQHCRFEYPFGMCRETHLQLEKVNTKGKTEHYKVKVITARNDPRVNRHQRVQLQGQRANCDINIVIDYHSCLEYLTKYASKAEKISSVARDAFVSVVTKLKDDLDANKMVKKLMMKSVGQRDTGSQEIMHKLKLKFFIFSYQVVSVSLDGS